MAASPAPVEVGAQGTIGSLVWQEIEYFRWLELDHQKQKAPTIDPRSKSGSPRKKKRAAGGGFLPRICSAVEITEAGRADRIMRTGYRNLRADEEELPED